MATETERKFLVLNNSFKTQCPESHKIQQGYLSSEPSRTVRIRIKDEKAYITVKGAGSDDGTQRFEWEKEISAEDGLQLMQLCEPGKIEKIRYVVECGEFRFEVDEFSGENEGLVLAEIELNKPDDEFDRPDWLGREVTGDARYYNSALSLHPYKNWR